LKEKVSIYLQADMFILRLMAPSRTAGCGLWGRGSQLSGMMYSSDVLYAVVLLVLRLTSIM
jgi:hypothetical protein